MRIIFPMIIAIYIVNGVSFDRKMSDSEEEFRGLLGQLTARQKGKKSTANVITAGKTANDEVDRALAEFMERGVEVIIRDVDEKSNSGGDFTKEEYEIGDKIRNVVFKAASSARIKETGKNASLPEKVYPLMIFNQRDNQTVIIAEHSRYLMNITL